MSKQPLVKTTFLPRFFNSPLKSFISSSVLICESEVDLLRLDSYSIISFNVAVAEPILPTTTPAARFENFTALSMSYPQAKEKPREAITVSPAPVTSYTSRATVG